MVAPAGRDIASVRLGAQTSMEGAVLEQQRSTDADLAEYAIRTHCPIDWPEGRRCLNCHRQHPCPVYERAHGVLTAAGWSEDEISKLDIRTGPWS